MLVKLYVVWGLLVVTAFAGLAASGVKMPQGNFGSTGGSGGTGSSYHGYSSGGGWGFGK